MSSSDEEEFEFETSEKEKEEEEEEEEEEEDFIDNDEPAPKSRKRTSRSPAKTNYAEDDDDDDDDDDDIPLAQLKSSKKKAKTTETKKKTPVKKTPVKKKVETKPEPKKSSNNDDYRTTAAAMFGSDCIKGQLIQKLLCRWWYAIDWPANLPAKPPKNYDVMDGLPGVYICTNGDQVGKIKDLRDMENKPSFSNFLSKDSDKLKDLLIKAVEEQKKALIKAEGEGTPTEKELKEMLKWTNKVNGDKADKEATRLLKKAGMAAQ